MAFTYKDIVDLSKPISYWRLEEPFVSNLDDSFDYPNGSDMTIQGEWYTYGAGSINNVREAQNGAMLLALENATAAVYLIGVQNSNQLHGDYDVEFELDDWLGTGAAHPYALLILSHNSGTYSEEYLGMYGSGANNYVSGGPTVQSGSLGTDGGRFRMTRVGTTITTYRWTGAWTQISLWTGRSTDPTVITLRVQTPATLGAIASASFLDFKVNSADAITPRKLESLGSDTTNIITETPVTAGTSLITSDPGQSVVFNGTSDYLRKLISDYRSTDTQGSIEAWFNTSAAAFQCIFSSSDTATTDHFFGILLTDTGTIRIQSRKAAVNNGIDTTNTFLGGSHHVVVNSDGSAWTIYVDGVLQATTVFAGSNNGDWLNDVTNRDNICIGADIRTTATSFFNGTIDEVAYYDRPLGADEIAKHWALGQSLEQYAQDTFYKAPINYWRMNDTAGTTCVDAVQTLDLSYVGTPSLDQPGLLDTSADTSVAFNGTTQHAIATVSDYRSTDTQGSIEAWFRTTISAGEGIIFASSDTASNSYFFYVSIGSTGLARIRTRTNTTDNNLVTSAIGLNDGETHHLVMTSDNSSYRCYVDGVEQSLSVSTGADDGNWLDWCTQRDNVAIGVLTYLAGDVAQFEGTIDEVAYYDYPLSAQDAQDRYILGKYTDAYDQVIADDNPLHWWKLDTLTEDSMRNCVLYMSMEGEHNTTFFENLVNPSAIASKFGDAVIYSGHKWGKGSYFSDGTGDQVTFPHSTDWELGGADYTIDCWIYVNSYPPTSSYRCIVSHHAGSNGWRLLITDAGALHMATNAGNGNGFYSADGVVPLNTWTHIAAVGTSNGTFSTGYVNGIQVATTGSHFINTLTNVLRVGATDSSNFIWHGYIDDLRILKGRAEWTRNFTPPTSAHSLNTIQNGTFRDNNITNWLIRGGTVDASGNTLRIQRAGAGIDAHGAYQSFSTTPGQAYNLEFAVTYASHYINVDVFDNSGLSPGPSLGGYATTVNGTAGTFNIRFVATGDTSWVLFRVTNSTTGTAQFDNIVLLPGIKDSIDTKHMGQQGRPLPGTALIPASTREGITFNGSTDAYVRDEDNFRGSDNEGSIEAWVLVNSSHTGIGTVFATAQESTLVRLTVLVTQTVTYLLVYNNTVFEQSYKATHGIPSDTPFHLVWTADGTSWKCYINGEDVSAVQHNGTGQGYWFNDLQSLATKIYIGKWRGSNTNYDYLDGELQDVLCYNYALTPTQIKSHYQTGYQRAYDRLVRSHSPVNYWKMDDTGSYALDSVGTEDLKLIGAPNIQVNSLLLGDAGYSMEFNGTQQYAEKTISEYRGSDTSGSFEAWFSLNSLPATSATFNLFSVNDDVTDGAVFGVQIRDISGTSYVGSVYYDGVAAADVPYGNVPVTIGETHHVVVVSTGTSYKIYLDGVAQVISVVAGANNGNWIGDLTDITDNLLIGAAKRGTYAGHFDGTLDEVAYYSTQLTARQVYDHWVEGNNPDDTLSGNATDTAGDPVDTVRIFSWDDYKFVKAVTPDANGDWSATVNPGEYGITYMKEGCQPITHGPYRVT